LIHARLAHLPRKAILQLLKNGAKGLPYKGKFKELCRPCLEARQRAENHGKEHVRHPDGKIGEHLHSDLAVVNLPDYSGFKYVLTVVDEISDEVVVTLLQTKDSKTVLAACKKTLQLISARTQKKLKTWQFDRGGEFLNEIFEDVPSSTLPFARLKEGVTLIDALIAVSLAASKGEARRAIEGGSVYINNRKAEGIGRLLTTSDLASETVIVLRLGKKKYALLRFE
jgi:hypothetical protein